MKIKILAAILFLGIIVIACSKEDDNPSTTNNTNNNGNGNGNGNSGEFDNSYMFSDDEIMCYPHSSNPSINQNGILSVVSKPCSRSGSKLDGYFKWQTRPTPGTYKVVGQAGAVTYGPNLADDEYSMIFYGHDVHAFYSVGGTVEISVSEEADSLLDLNWTDVEMIYGGDSTTVITFSGNLKGL